MFKVNNKNTRTKNNVNDVILVFLLLILHISRTLPYNL